MRSDRLALAILTALITVTFADVLLGINSLYVRDISHYYHPAKHVLRDIVLGGDFPSWNPFFSAGQPMAANPEHEVFYPLTWLILLPSFEVGFGLLIVAHLYISAWAMYAFLRSLDLAPAAAFLGALSFVFGGVVMSYLNLLPCLFSVAWLPLICLFARRYVRDGRRRDFAAAAFFFALQLLVGEPSTIVQTGFLLGAYALTRGVRAVPRIAAVTFAALLLSAVQMLPAIDHAAQSVRARGLAYENVVSWSTPPARLIELVQPNVFGHHLLNEKRLYWAAALYPGRGVPFLHGIYSGLLVTALVLTGLLAGTRGRGLTLILFATSLLLAFGGHTPLWRLLHDSGLARSIRYPEKFLLLGLFAAIVFASVVLHELLGGNARVRRVALIVAGALTAVTGLAAIVASTPAHARIFIALWNPPARLLEEMLPAARSGWLLTAARAVLLFVLVRNLGRVRAATGVALLAVFVALDLGMNIPELAPRVPGTYYREPPQLARILPPDRAPYRLFHLASWQMGSAGAYMTPQPDIYWLHRNAMYPPMPSRWGIRTVLEVDFDRTALLPTTDFTEAMWDISRLRADWLNPIAAMSNAWYCGVYVPAAEAFARAGGDRRIVQPVRVMELDRHPRYYIAERVETIRGRDDFVRKVAGGRFPDRTAFVAGPSWQPAPGVVHAFEETANRARIDVETAGRSFLVMSVTPQKYWRVAVDGVEAEAVVTNLGYQGVVIPGGGRHRVEMRYRNPLIAIGAVISICAAVLIALMALVRAQQDGQQDVVRRS